MAHGYWGSQEYVESKVSTVKVDLQREINKIIESTEQEKLGLLSTISDLERKLEEKVIEYVPYEVIKEIMVPVERIVEKEISVERLVEKEVKIYIDKIVEIIKEVPVDVVREVERIKEVIVPVEKIVEKEVQVIKEVPVEIIKEVIVPVERVVEKEVQIVKEFPVYQEKIIKEFVDRPIEVVKEVEKEVIKLVKFVPMYVYGALLVETLIIIALLIK